MKLTILLLIILYIKKCTAKVIQLEFDQDYECNKKTGWSLCINGSFCSQLEPSIFICLKKGLESFSDWDTEYKSDVLKEIISKILFK